MALNSLPQGTVLAPLLFLILPSDVDNNIDKRSLTSWAADSSIRNTRMNQDRMLIKSSSGIMILRLSVTAIMVYSFAVERMRKSEPELTRARTSLTVAEKKKM